jgi:biopolymer transport protein ExbD
VGFRRAKANHDVSGDVQMTPMIDVVFQLLVYFIVTIKPIDVAAHLDVFRPSAQSAPKESKTPPRMIRIQIFNGALLVNDRSLDMPGLIRILDKLGAISRTQTVVISCARDSRHERLVEVLNACARAGLTNLSVTSMN